MAKKGDDAAVAALCDAMLRVLDGLKARGQGAYPPTLRDLADRSGGEALADALVIKAAGKKDFTSRAAAVKAGGKVTHASPVYFKGDVPKKDPAAELAARLLPALESLRRLGPEAYPPTLRRLAELCDVKASDTRVPKAAAHATFAAQALVVAKAKGKPNLDAPVVLKAELNDGGQLLPALLTFALKPVTTTVKKKPAETTAFSPSEIARLFVEEARGAVAGALERGLDGGGMPEGVAWVVIKGEPRLFLQENAGGLKVGRRPEPPPADPPATQPQAPERQPAVDGFAGAFRAEFERLDHANGRTNFVKLSELRRALSAFGRREFDDGLRQLRLEREFSLNSFEGLHGSITAEDREAALLEGGSLLAYASRSKHR